MKKFFNLMVKVMILVLLIAVSIVPSVSAIQKSGDHNYVERTEDGIKVNGATFRKVEQLDSKDLSFGVKYYNDSIMVSTTLQERMTEYALGGSSYGTVPFVMNQEYSGKSYVVEVPVDTGVEVIPWQKITNGVWQLATVKAMAEDFEAHYPEYKVLAAINGSFFDINATTNYSHTSSGDISAFGENYKLTNCNHQLGFTNDGSAQSIIEQVTSDKSARPVIDVYDANGNIIYTTTVNKTNEEPGAGEVSVFYGLYNSLHRCEGIAVTDAFIVNDRSTVSVAYNTNVFYGKGPITEFGSANLTTNQFAIKSNNDSLTAKLAVGTTIRVQYTSEVINQTGNTIYYVDKLVDNAEICDTVADQGVLSGYSQYRYPRTLLGKKADGTIVMTCTDGRQASKGLYGLNGSESAAEMMYYGCDEAWCFDGGGSTSMCVLIDGELQYVNSPSDGSQRSDGNAMLVVVKVPTVEVSNTSTQDSITFNVNVVKEVAAYSDLYIGIGEEKKHIEGTDPITFTGLEVHSNYLYKLYAKIGENYIDLPYAGTVNTARHNVIFEKLTVKTDGDNYKVFYDIVDVDNAVSTIVLLVNGKRFMSKNGVITVSKEYGGVLTTGCKFVIAYDLNDAGGKRNVQTVEYETRAEVLNSEVLFASVISETTVFMNSMYGK